LAVCEAVKHWRYYLECCFKFHVVRYHDTLRHPLMQPNNMLNKGQSLYMWDLQAFVGSMSLAHRKEASDQADPLSRRPKFVPQTTVPLLWDGMVPSDSELRPKSKTLLEDAHLNIRIVNALRLSPEFTNLICEGYS
jgi:hypothetical protein